MNKLRSLLSILLVAGFVFVLGGQVQAQSLQENMEPISNAGPDQVVTPSSAVTLDGSASSDPDGDLPLTYQWTQTGGTTVILSDSTAVNPTFTAPAAAEVLTFELSVTDSLALTDATPDVVQITVSSPPVADAGSDQTVGTNSTVTLDGSASTDSDENLPLTYQWTQTSGTTVTLSDPTAVNPTFTAPNAPETLTFSLMVTDSLAMAALAPDTVTITVDYNHVYLPIIMTPFPPAAFNKSGPVNNAVDQSVTPTLSWGATSPLSHYEYCYDTTNDNDCTGWINNRKSTSVTLPKLAPNTIYYWQVRAWNSPAGPSYANGSATAFWSFKTIPFPAAFSKLSPSNGATNQSITPLLSWTSTSPATYYEYCFDATNDNACTTWIPNGTSTSVTLPTLSLGTTYYWQVRAWNGNGGPTYANGSANAFWPFTTTATPPANPILNGGFELGDVNWSEYSSHGWDIIMNPAEGLPVSAHNGTWAAWLGGEYSDISYISQTITIPAGRSYLHYWIITGSTDLCGYDFFEILLGSIVVYSQSVCDENNTYDWVHRVLDLTPYAGTTQTIMFRVTTDYALNSNAFLDDISFEVTSITTISMDQITVTKVIDPKLMEKLIQARKEDFDTHQ